MKAVWAKVFSNLKQTLTELFLNPKKEAAYLAASGYCDRRYC